MALDSEMTTTQSVADVPYVLSPKSSNSRVPDFCEMRGTLKSVQKRKHRLHWLVQLILWQGLAIVLTGTGVFAQKLQQDK